MSFHVEINFTIDLSFVYQVHIPISNQNTHPMETQENIGAYKPKVITIMVTVSIPCTVRESMQHPKWVEAIWKEFEVLLKNGTWELVPLPKNEKSDEQ